MLCARWKLNPENLVADFETLAMKVDPAVALRQD
jgi:hypothetical protein